MGLKNDEINPLAVQGIRQLEFCPAHFQKITFLLNTDAKHVTDWIYENTDSRFYAGAAVAMMDGQHKICYCVGFENHSELGYFALLLTTINVPQPYY